MEKLNWELRRKWVLRQRGENKCYCVFRTNGGLCSGLIVETSHKVSFCGTLLGVLCSCCYANVSNKTTYFLLLVGKS